MQSDLPSETHNKAHTFLTSTGWRFWKLLSTVFSAVKGALKVIIFFLIIIGFFALIFPSSLSFHEVESYPITKSDGNTLALNRMAYKVSSSEQTVIYWMPSFDITPSKLINYIVRDKKKLDWMLSRWFWLCLDEQGKDRI